MKKIIPFVFAAIVAMNTSYASSTNVKGPGDEVVLNDQCDDQLSVNEITRLVDRYQEIQKMDKGNLSSAEKRQLKNESTNIKDILKEQDNVVIYLSGAAIIIIIILLILLL